jgi:hypothetical protein
LEQEIINRAPAIITTADADKILFIFLIGLLVIYTKIIK